MAQACTPTVITLSGCPHCANLETMLQQKGIKYNVDMSQACQCYPCAVLCNGTHVSSCGGNAEYDVLNAIVASVAVAAPTSTTTTPVSTTKTTPSTTSTTDEAWKTSLWGNELTIDWGAKNAPPTIAQTAAGYEPPDVQLTPVLPLPPTVAQGIIIALRDRKKPRGRKVA